jgi:hypothetical protein
MIILLMVLTWVPLTACGVAGITLPAAIIADEYTARHRRHLPELAHEEDREWYLRTLPAEVDTSPLAGAAETEAAIDAMWRWAEANGITEGPA